MEYGDKDEATGLICSCMCTAPEAELCDHKVYYDSGFVGCDNEQHFICSFYIHTHTSIALQRLNKKLDMIIKHMDIREE